MVEIIKEIIEGYWKKDTPKVIDRNIELKEETELINDITGIRRSGKTSLMFLKMSDLIKRVGKNSTIYINFENKKLVPLKQTYFDDIMEFIEEKKLFEKYKKVYLFLDEVQRIENWERFVRSIYDDYKEKLKIFVSGSSAHLLSRDYGKLLTGRHLTTTVFPLSFKEFLNFKNYKNNDKIKLKIFLKEYLKYGGFPEVVLSNNKEEIIGQLFNDILSKDVLSRAEIRKEQVLEEFVYYLSSNISNKLSFNKMSNYFKSRGVKISVQTLENYFYFLKEAFLFFDNLIFSYKVKDQLQYNRKIYCIDNGVASLMGFKFSEDLGKLYENAVAVELLRRANLTTKVFYWHDQQQNEVDFVVKDKLKIEQLIQVCYDIDNPDTKKREIKALLKASEELKCKNLLVITKDEEREEKVESKKIRYMPLWKWLLR
ncbi:ATP-binding protein [Candidatus Pacearchaeota archaeon]|nr:ATP-binding protein [Candidatus Pacearchaeota archaeon]